MKSKNFKINNETLYVLETKRICAEENLDTECLKCEAGLEASEVETVEVELLSGSLQCSPERDMIFDTRPHEAGAVLEIRYLYQEQLGVPNTSVP